MQFHPEVTAAGIGVWAAQGRRQKQFYATESAGQALLQETDARIGATTEAAYRLYAAFFAGI